MQGDDQPNLAEIPQPPKHLEAEQALIGCLLVSGLEAWHHVEHVPLEPVAFFDPVHQRIWQFVRDHARQRMSFDATVAAVAFASDAAIKELGGPQYLGTLVLQACDTSSAADYAALVHDLFLRRRLIETAVAAARAAGKPGSLETGARTLEGLQQALGKLEPGSRHSAASAADAAQTALEQALAVKRSGRPVGLPTGLPSLDLLYAPLQPGFLVTLAGRPGMGKSAAALSFARRVAESGHGVVYFSLEMEAAEHGARLLSDIAFGDPEGAEGDLEVEYQNLVLGRVGDRDLAKLDGISALLAKTPLLFDDRGRVPFAEISTRIRAKRRELGDRYGARLDMVVIDHLGLLEPPLKPGRGMGRTEATTEITAELKRIARDEGICILLLSQLNREVERRDDKRPILADLRDSGSIEQDSNVVIFAYRDAYYAKAELGRLRAEGKGESEQADRLRDRLAKTENQIELDVAKRRGGKTGRVTLRCEIGFNAIRELPDTRLKDTTQQGSFF